MTMAKSGFKRKVPDRKELTIISLTHTHPKEHKLLGTKVKLPIKIANSNNKQRQITQVHI